MVFYSCHKEIYKLWGLNNRNYSHRATWLSNCRNKPWTPLWNMEWWVGKEEKAKLFLFFISTSFCIEFYFKSPGLWNMYNIMYETSHQSRFDARYWILGAGALGRPRGMEWGGRREEGSGWGTRVYLWQIHFDI